MKILERLSRKKTRRVIGLMSGTSVDAIDAVLTEISGCGTKTRLKVLSFNMQGFPKRVRETILKNSLPGSGTVDDVCRLNVLLAHLYADAVKEVIRKARLKMTDIDLIGSHGQTVHHLPRRQRLFGKPFGATLQIGDPSTIATLTGITTVGDFRMADMAAGGQGAPLVPYVDFLLFRSLTKNRMLLNLGGIANFTFLPKRCSAEEVIAFDTGPGNMVIDALMKSYFGKSFDNGGHVALRGEIIPRLFRWMLEHPFLKKSPPKSTGREVFGEDFVSKLQSRAKGERREDVIATATAFTPFTIHDQFTRFIWDKKVDEIFVSGGGSHNKAMMMRLEHYFPSAAVHRIEKLGISSDAKEAICFAVLANETICGNASNLPSVTGASRRVVLGKICL